MVVRDDDSRRPRVGTMRCTAVVALSVAASACALVLRVDDVTYAPADGASPDDGPADGASPDDRPADGASPDDGPADGASPDDGPATVIASGQTNPTGIASDGQFVYWTNETDLGAVSRCPLAGCGGAPIPVATGEAKPHAIVAGGFGVAWTNLGTNTLRDLLADAGDAAPIDCQQFIGSPIELRLRGTYLFPVAGGLVDYCASEKCGSFCNAAIDGWLGLSAADVDSDGVFFAVQAQGAQEIRRCPTGSYCPRVNGPSTVVVPAPLNARDLVVDPLRVYWVDNTAGLVMSAPKTSSGAVVPSILAGGQNHPWSLVVDGNNLYFTNLGTGGDGQIVRAPKNGDGPVVVLAGNLPSPSALVVEGAYVYWTNQGGGTVMRIAK